MTVKLPALMLQVDADSVLKDPSVLPDIGEAVAAGATAIILSEGVSSGASVLYDAACALKEALRGRAALLLVDRTDIASAAEADGVLLTDQGAHGCISA
jgi:thiamine monophosphate synthase